jgi:NhaP-type Na+/H+ and K+/H+ antiporter
MSDVMRTISPAQRKSLEFIKKELADGQPKEVVALQMKARAEGIPTRSLTASRKMLRVAVFRDGQCGKFYWKLADEVR